MSSVPGWRQQLRGWSLILFGGLAAFMVNTLIQSHLVAWVAGEIRSFDSIAARLILGLLVMDLGKLLALLPVALLLASAVPLRPLVAASGLVLANFALEAVVNAILQQASWLWGEPAVLACRAAAAAVLVWVVAIPFSRARSRSAGPEAARSTPASEKKVD